MARNIDRKQLKSPDQFVSFWTRVMGQVQGHGRAILIGALALVGVVAAVWIAGVVMDRNAAKVSADFARLERIAAAPLTATDGAAPQFKTEKERSEAVIKEADAFAAAHGGSKLRDEALLIKARHLMVLGKGDEAVSLYQELLGGGVDSRLRFIAHEGLAYAHEATGQLDKAIATFGALADESQNAGGFYRDRALLNRARLLERKGNGKEAEKVLREILEKAPATALREEINQRLAALEGK